MHKLNHPNSRLPKYAALVMSVCLVAGSSPFAYAKAGAIRTDDTGSEMPAISAKSAVVYDATEGNWITRFHADDKLYPASLTKLLTAILLVEHTKPTDLLTASQKAAAQEPSNISLHPGEKLTAKDALYAMLLHSANDVAYMAAEHVGGSASKFADLMNKKAAEIGMKHSHFVTPNGLHDQNHYSTAEDMAILMKTALTYPEIAEALKTKSYSLHRNFQPALLVNQNELLSNPDVIGGKSGFTDEAGSCLIEAMKEKDHVLIAVNMKDPTRDTMYSDSKSLLTEAFNEYQPYFKSNQETLDTLQPLGGIRYALHLQSNYNTKEYVRISQISTKLTLDSSSPIDGKPVGTLHIFYYGTKLIDLPVMATLLRPGILRPNPLLTSIFILGLIFVLWMYQRCLKLWSRFRQRKRTTATRAIKTISHSSTGLHLSRSQLADFGTAGYRSAVAEQISPDSADQKIPQSVSQ